MDALVAVKQEDVRSALRLLLRHHLRLERLGEAQDCAALWEQVRSDPPALLLVDWDMLRPDCRSALCTLHALRLDLAVTVLSLRSEIETEALAAGADAFVWLGQPPDEVEQTLRAVRPVDSRARHAASPIGRLRTATAG